MAMFPALALAVLLQVPAAPEGPVLYAIENIPSDEGVVETRSLVRLSIGGDHRLVKDTSLTRDQRFFSEFGRHRIALGRFVVTPDGGVVDIPTRKVIHEGAGKRLGIEDGKVFYRIEGAAPAGGVFSFDLKETKSAQVEDGGRWDLPGVRSPDGRMSVEGGRSDWTIRLHQIGQAPRKLGQFAIAYSKYSSAWPGAVPCLWLDDARFLVGRTNHQLDILTIAGEVEASISVKDATTEIVSPPSLWRDPLGRVIYSCGDRYFVIDVPGRAASRLENFALGHGFEVSVAEDEESRRAVKYQSRVIGQWVCNAIEARVAPGRIAFPYVRPSRDANLGYPDGVAVWVEDVGDWRTVAMWVEDLVDWAP